MQGDGFSFLAVIGIPDAWQCLIVVGPFFCIAVVWWFVNRLDQIIAYLFPHWEWEREMGWLNLRAERRADAFMRGLGYLFYGLLAVALYGIVGASRRFRPWINGIIPTVCRSFSSACLSCSSASGSGRFTWASP